MELITRRLQVAEVLHTGSSGILLILTRSMNVDRDGLNKSQPLRMCLHQTSLLEYQQARSQSLVVFSIVRMMSKSL